MDSSTNDPYNHGHYSQFQPYPSASSPGLNLNSAPTAVTATPSVYQPYSSPVPNSGNYMMAPSSGMVPTDMTSSMSSGPYDAGFTHARHHQQQQYQQQQPFQPPQPPPPFAMPNLMSDPMVQNMALQYGHSVLGQGRQALSHSVGKYVSLARVKYYFAVDTAYVARKIRLFFFPFTNTDWSVRYNSEEPIQPRHEVNAPDLYIPCMAFVTYIVMAGFLLGRQQRFSPELLGLQFSSALGWLLLELLLVLLSIYLLNVRVALKTLDLIAFSGYKYVGINVCLLSSLLLNRTGYLLVLLYTCSMCSLFLVRTLKVQIQPAHEDTGSGGGGGAAGGVKRRTYLLLLISALQPLFIFWLSYSLVQFSDASLEGAIAV